MIKLTITFAISSVVSQSDAGCKCNHECGCGHDEEKPHEFPAQVSKFSAGTTMCPISPNSSNPSGTQQACFSTSSHQLFHWAWCQQGQWPSSEVAYGPSDLVDIHNTIRTDTFSLHYVTPNTKFHHSFRQRSANFGKGRPCCWLCPALFD